MLLLLFRLGQLLFYLLLLFISSDWASWVFFYLWTVGYRSFLSFELQLHDYNNWKHTLGMGTKYV